MDAQPQGIVCHVYTKARRHPKVIGVIGGKVMPYVSTNAQLGAFIGTALFLLKFRRLYGFLPIPLQLIVIVGLPVGAWFAVRFWQPDDRSPLGFVAAGAAYLTRPRQGRRRGRAVRISARGRAAGGNFFFSGG